MEYELYPIENDELCHHGVKGMKWGVRRYQNKDGSLTNRGRIRYGAGKAAEGAKKAVKGAIEKHKSKKAAEKESKRIQKLLKKPIKKLTEAELAERTAFAKKQKELRQIESDNDRLAASVRPFMGKILHEALVPGLISAGKTVVTNFATKKLSDLTGLNEKDTANALDALTKVNGDFSKLTDKQVKDLAEREKNVNTAKQMQQQSARIGNNNQNNQPTPTPNQNNQPTPNQNNQNNTNSILRRRRRNP